MFENTALWAIDSLGEMQLKSLANLLAAERMANPQAKAYGPVTAGPAIDAERNGLPITIREAARFIASSSARRANPSAAAPTVVRNTSSVAIATLKPSPGWPSSREAGTKQSSKRIVATGCGEIISSRSTTLNPGVSASTTKAEIPLAPAASPVRANTT